MGSKGRKKPSLHSLSRSPIDVRAFFKELRGESDRASALIAGEAISDGLRDLLRFYFVLLEKDDIDHLFHDPGAPLGDFASRTIVSFALGLISPQERLVANIIRSIRNGFAHTLAQIDFSHELIVTELSKIPPGEPYPNMKEMNVKAFFVEVSLIFYVTLLNRGHYLLDRRSSALSESSGLGGARHVPVYVLAQMVPK